MRFLLFFWTILLFPNATSASYVVSYTYIHTPRLLQTPLPTASSAIILELQRCEASKPKPWNPPCGYVYSSPYDLEQLIYQGECQASTLSRFPCQYVDSSSLSIIVEWCQASSSFQPGLYLFRGQSDSWYYPWFNSDTMDFACQYGSSITDEPAYYGFAPNQKSGFHALFYQYYVNLKSGHAYFLLLPGSQLRILDWVDEDLPS